MEFNKRTSKRVIIGLFLVFIGLFIWGVKANMIDESVKQLIMSWPSILILVAILILFSTKRNYSSSIVLFIIGTFFLLIRASKIYPGFSLWGWDPQNLKKYLLPIIFNAIGLYLIFTPHKGRRRLNCKRNQNKTFRSSASNKGTKTYEKNIVFGNSEQSFVDTEFKGGKVNVILGSATLDLRKASLPPEGASLQINVVLGDFILFLPEEWNVITRLDVVLGESKNMHSLNDSNQEPKLTIYGTVVFGNQTTI